jgi:hypothetical protein
MCTQFLHHIHLSIPFSCPFPLVPTSTLGRTFSAFLFSDFVEEKRKRKKEKKFTSCTTLLYPPSLSPPPGTVSTVIIFAFTYFTQFLHHIHPSTPFPCYLPSSTGTNSHPG